MKKTGDTAISEFVAEVKTQAALKLSTENVGDLISKYYHSHIPVKNAIKQVFTYSTVTKKSLYFMFI